MVAVVKTRTATEIARDIKHIAMEVGLMRLSKRKPAPISEIIVMRALVMLYAIHRYEAKEKKPPKQTDLCKNTYDGLIKDTYEKFGLSRIGHVTPCKGASHLQEAAHLLADAGLIPPRSYRTNRKHNPISMRALKRENREPSIRSDYTLTPDGQVFANYLFGDPITGRGGFPPVQQGRDGEYYSAWLDFIYNS